MDTGIGSQVRHGMMRITSPANTFMNGDPWNGPYTHNTDFAVPDCGAVPPPPPATPSLAQGPAAPAGYRYAITIDHFSPNSSI
jgi:hypothetical protein